MYIVLITLHVVLCLILIVTILLQAGKGGGLTEMFGGETAQSVLGTQAPILLKRITEASAVGFIVTSLVLGMVTARRGQSLFESSALPFLPIEQGGALPFVPGTEGGTADDMGELPPVKPLDLPVEGFMDVQKTDIPATALPVEVEEVAVQAEGQDENKEEGGQ